MNSRSLLILATAALVIIAAVIAYLNMQPSTAPLPIQSALATPAPAAPATAPEPPAPKSDVVAHLKPSATPAPAKPEAPVEIPEWSAKIDRILGMQAGNTETAQMLINMLPTLPPDGQAEAAQHITNLIEDKDYGKVLPLLRNPALPEEVQDILVTDLMNREDPVKLPALLDVAKLPTHPYHEEALTDLQIFLDADHGTDWAKWDSSLKQYLQKQAAENQ